MENVLFKNKIRNAKMKILQVASALTICLGGIFGSTLPVAANTVGTSVYVYCKNQTSAGSFTISGNLNVDVANRSGTKGGYRVHGTVSVSSSSNGSWWGKGIYLKNGNNSLLGSKIFKDTGSVAVDFSTSTWNWGTGATSETLYLIVGAANSNKTAMNYSITNNGNNQNVSATTSGGNTYNGYAYAVKMSIPATAATLSYNANGGSVSPGSKTCSIGGTYGTLPTPTRTGYSFSGWYTSASGGNQVSSSTKMGSSNTTIYAHWTANTYTVSYNGNGATSGNTASSNHTYDSSKRLTTNGYVRDGYAFLGWSTSPNGSVQYSNGQNVSNLTASNGATINLYAQWKSLGYEINYDGNGADGGSTSTQYAPFNQTTTLNKNGYYKKGYKFKEWNTKTNGSGESYKDQQSISVDSNKTVTKK